MQRGKKMWKIAQVGEIKPTQSTFQPLANLWAKVCQLLAEYRETFCGFNDIFTALQNENSVCTCIMYVCLSNASHVWIVTKRKKNQSRFLYHTKNHLAYFSDKNNGWWWTTPSTWKFWVKATVLSEITDFQSIFACSASAVTPAKKVQLTLIGSLLRAFQWAWSSYVAPKPRKGGSKPQNYPFPPKNRNLLEESLLQSFFV